MHRLPAIVTSGNQVDVVGNSGVKYDRIDAERDERQQNGLDQSAIRLKLRNRPIRIAISPSVDVDVYIPL